MKYRVGTLEKWEEKRIYPIELTQKKKSCLKNNKVSRLEWSPKDTYKLFLMLDL